MSVGAPAVKLGIAATLAACVAWPPVDALAQDRPNIVIAVNQLARNLEPARQTGNVDVRVYYSMFDTLIRRDFRDPPDVGVRLLPGLAESWERTAPDTVELRLRQGVTCHDGSPFDAEDVLFTFSEERLWGEGSYFPRGRTYFGHLDRVEAVDPYTVRFVTRDPDVIFEERLSSYTAFVVCNEPWDAFRQDGVPFNEWMETAFNELNWTLAGTGPYRAAGYRNNDFIRLEAHDAYWGGAPAAQSITFQEVPEVAARVAGVVSGDYQMAVDIPPDQLGVVDQYDDVISRSVVLDNTHVLVFNETDPVLSNQALRHALSLAIDRETLRTALWNGENYTPNGHQLPSFGAMYNADRPGYVYDPERARELVAESGYDGAPISFRLIPGYYLNGVEAAQVVQEMWRAVGITVELEFVESFGQVRDDGAQIYAWSNTYRLPDPTGAIFANWGPESGIQDRHGFFDPPEEYNEIAIELFRVGDIEQRYEMFQRMLDIFEDEMAMTMLYNPVVTFIMNSDIDWTPYSLYFMDFRPDNFSVAAADGS